MIPRSKTVALSSLLIAAGANVCGFYGFYSEPEVKIAAAGAPDVAITGNAFADLAAGTISPVEPTETLDQTEPTEVPESDVETAVAVDPNEAVETREATEAQSTEVNAAQTKDVDVAVETELQDTNAVTEAATVANVEPVVTAQPELTNSVDTLQPSASLAVPREATPLQSLAPQPLIAVLMPLQPTQPQVLEEAQPAEAVDQLVAEDLNPAAVQRSLRPLARPASIAARQPAPAPRRTETPRQQPTAQQPQGNAEVNARAGAQTAQPQSQSTATQSGSNANTTQTSSASNADISNYRGQVRQRINRANRLSNSARGTVRIRLVIGSNGRLQGTSVVSSSGNTRFDRLALQTVRRAGPFPRPPGGQQQTFTIAFTN